MRHLRKISFIVVSILALVAIGVGLYDRLLPPTGERLVLSHNDTICVVNAAGWHRRCLVAGKNPSWSPDGQRIAFEVRTLPGQDGNPRHASSIYVVSTDGSEVARLTDEQGYDEAPAWSPDGNYVAFHSNRDGSWDLYTANVHSGELEQVTDDQPPNYEPAWSPDGEQIAFFSTPGLGEDLDIYVINANGDNVRRLTENESDNARPAWSPDGEQIAFETDRDGNWEIYTMNVDGSNQIRLTNHPQADRGPVWSPNGGKIAFLSGRSGRTGRILYEGITIQLPDVYVMNADGTGVKRLTYGLFGTYDDLDWSLQ